MAVRTNLGLSPADSLLYAPVTVITEGVTEVLGIPFLLQRLAKENVADFENIEPLLSLSHFIDGQGDSFELWCRLAKSQGSKPIIFVDGDKIRRVNQQDIKRKHQDVPIVHLKEGDEFEVIVPQESYFQALSETTGIEATVDLFNQWGQTANLPPKIMFTKRVNRWLEENFPDAFYDKPKVMRRALEITDVSEIQLDKFKELVVHIKKLLT